MKSENRGMNSTKLQTKRHTVLLLLCAACLLLRDPGALIVTGWIESDCLGVGPQLGKPACARGSASGLALRV